MVNKIFKIVFLLFCTVLLVYLSLPNFIFPSPPPDSLQSQEPADLESPLRRGYFTDYTRAEVLTWYENQLDHSSFLGLRLPTFLLNYPPEDAQTLIRDQTGSTFLQEIVHPFRESVYINGFEPASYNNKPTFFVGERYWKQKIIIRYIPSSVWARLGVFAATAAFVVILYRQWRKSLTNKE